MVGQIVSTITEMVTGLLGGLGSGIATLFNDLFIDKSVEGATTISNLGIWVIALLGVSIALGAVAWVSTLIRNRG